jgi:uncharacterized membrane protein
MTRLQINRSRHLLKAITYRVYSSVITMAIATWISGDAGVGTAIGGADFFIKIFTYYVHERLWYRVPFGVKREE